MGYGELEDLEIFKSAERIADRFYELARAWQPMDRDTLGIQLIRAADSIGANIAESYGRYHYGDQIRFLYYARGSLYEVKYWVRRAGRRGLLDPEVVERALLALDELAVKLNGYIRNLRQRQYGDGRLAESSADYLVTRGDSDSVVDDFSIGANGAGAARSAELDTEDPGLPDE